MQERPLPDGRGSDREEEEAIGSLLARLAQWDTPLRELFGELAIQVERLPEAEQAALREPLVELLQQDPPNLTTAASSAALQHLLRQVAAMGLLSGEPAARSQAALTQPSPRLHPARLRQPSADKAWPQRPPAAPTELPTDALSYADSDEVYVENAGLVLLWPFLSSLYTRLELLTDNRFQDDEARHRAVGLLQHLATGELEPQEYTLPLAKLLCGMDHSEVFHFGPPITPAETAECTDLLSSAIASAEVLGDMSLAGFREALLLRKGVLSARDGVWLLRVERTTYDLVLDQIPWPLSWIKLPWMETPLCVEW